MKPDSWGSTAPARSLNKVDEPIYMPPPMPNVSSPHHMYAHSMAAPFHAANPMENQPISRSNFNPHSYQVHSNMYSNASSMPPAIPASQPSQSFAIQHAVPYQHAHYTLCNSAEQNFSSQPHVAYPSANAQNYYQQPQFYPQQPMYPSQPAGYPAAPVPPPMSYSCAQSLPAHYQPNSSFYSNAQPSLPPAPKFDPYRPQPVGAYDIPRPPLLNPQDVYRPGGLLAMNQGPSLSGNASDHSYEQNQYVPSSSFANLSMLNH